MDPDAGTGTPPSRYSWIRKVMSPAGPPSTTRLVLSALAIHMDSDGGSCFPSTRLLAEETGLSHRSVLTHLEQAAEVGWIRRKPRGHSGRGWRLHAYEPAIPDEPDEVVKEVHHEKGERDERDSPPIKVRGEGGSPAQPDGGGERGSSRKGGRGEPHDVDVVKEVHQRFPMSSPVTTPSPPTPPPPTPPAPAVSYETDADASSETLSQGNDQPHKPSEAHAPASPSPTPDPDNWQWGDLAGWFRTEGYRTLWDGECPPSWASQNGRAWTKERDLSVLRQLHKKGEDPATLKAVIERTAQQGDGTCMLHFNERGRWDRYYRMREEVRKASEMNDNRFSNVLQALTNGPPSPP